MIFQRFDDTEDEWFDALEDQDALYNALAVSRENTIEDLELI